MPCLIERQRRAGAVAFRGADQLAKARNELVLAAEALLEIGRQGIVGANAAMGGEEFQQRESIGITIGWAAPRGRSGHRRLFLGTNRGQRRRRSRGRSGRSRFRRRSLGASDLRALAIVEVFGRTQRAAEAAGAGFVSCRNHGTGGLRFLRWPPSGHQLPRHVIADIIPLRLDRPRQGFRRRSGCYRRSFRPSRGQHRRHGGERLAGHDGNTRALRRPPVSRRDFRGDLLDLVFRRCEVLPGHGRALAEPILQGALPGQQIVVMGEQFGIGRPCCGVQVRRHFRAGSYGRCFLARGFLRGAFGHRVLALRALEHVFGDAGSHDLGIGGLRQRR